MVNPVDIKVDVNKLKMEDPDISKRYWIRRAQEAEIDNLRLKELVRQASDDCTGWAVELEEKDRLIAKLKVALSCKELGCNKGIIDTRWMSDYGVMHYGSSLCPICGELWKKLREGKSCL